MNLEGNTSAAAGAGLPARIRRSWERDSHLSWTRRVRKGLKFVSQLLRGRSALKACTRVGKSARVAGRLRVQNFGSIDIGDHLNVNSTWVPIEMLTGPDGRIKIGDDVLVNFGTVIAAGSDIKIGSGTMIGPHCIISDVAIPESVLGPESAPALPIEIGRGVWLAGRVTVRPGVKIGDGAVVVAGSIVESDIPAHFMASGIPARLLPRINGAPAPASASGAESFTPVPAAPSRAAPRLRGGVISDFSLDDLVYELAIADGSPALGSAVVSPGPLPQMLTAPPPADARDFAVVWTTPEAAVPAFARMLNGEPVEEGELLCEVDAFCAWVEQCAANYRFVLLPSWTQPAHARGRGFLDGRPGGLLCALSAMNHRLLKRAGSRPNVFVFDAARWQAAAGPTSFNPRGWYIGHMAMARPVVAEAARDIRAALAALSGRQRKVLALRSDDALWAGQPGAAAPAALGQACVAFQQALRDLRRRGVLLALVGGAPKSQMLESIRNLPGAVLRAEDFADFGSAEGDEPAKVGALAARLGVELDDLVYVDARNAVRTRLRTALPGVYAPDWPTDKLLFPSALQSLHCFDAVNDPMIVKQAAT